MLKQKQINFLYVVCFISFIFQYVCLTEITLKNEYLPKNINASEYTNYFYLNNHPKFDYLNGLWIMFGGIFFFSIFCLLELPVKGAIFEYEIIKRYYKKKLKRKGFSFH